MNWPGSELASLFIFKHMLPAKVFEPMDLTHDELVRSAKVDDFFSGKYLHKKN